MRLEDAEVVTINQVNGLLAYFDPGSGSLVLQAIVGGTAGLLVFLRIAWEAIPTILRSRKSSRNPSNRGGLKRGHVACEPLQQPTVERAGRPGGTAQGE